MAERDQLDARMTEWQRTIRPQIPGPFVQDLGQNEKTAQQIARQGSHGRSIGHRPAGSATRTARIMRKLP